MGEVIIPSERGYLHEPFRVFYNVGIPSQEVLPHYHDFDKLVILLRGHIGYMIEEQQYSLDSGSIVLVRAGMIHRPLLHYGDEYERIIIYLSSDFLGRRPGLGRAFDLSASCGKYVISTDEVRRLIEEDARRLSDDYCAQSNLALLLQESRLTAFLIELGDIVNGSKKEFARPISTNKIVLSAIDYISDNITDELDIDTIAKETHVNRSYLMHVFKAETGYTVKEFVTDKRLFLAKQLIDSGRSMAAASELSGFTSYSSFFRSYRDKYGVSPKRTGKNTATRERIAE
ncbi:MAG: helix-turn-helix domain-containing protein [Lachnospiraceae bacterium]|nr:helix-turn-helix domain-containing protein [Candidatus Minthocola equi]